MKRLSLNERRGTTVSSLIVAKSGPCGSNPLVRLSNAAGASRKNPLGLPSPGTVSVPTSGDVLVDSGSTLNVDGVKRWKSPLGATACACEISTTPADVNAANAPATATA